MGYADVAEEAKRRTVLTRKPEVVLVKFIDFVGCGGIKIRDKDEAARNAALIDEAKKRELDPAVYGRQVDTGFQVMNNARQVLIDLIDSGVFGLKLVEVYRERYQRSGRWQIDLVLKYASEDEAIEMPADVQKVFTKYRFAHCSVFANWKFRNPESPTAGQFRLDTINLKNGREVNNDNGVQLVTRGNTYRLQNALTGAEVSVEETQEAAAAAKK